MTITDDILNLAESLAKSDPTAALILNFVDDVIGVFHAATATALAAELTEADALADVAEVKKFPPTADQIAVLSGDTLTDAGEELVKTGVLSPETGLQVLANAAKVVKAMQDPVMVKSMRLLVAGLIPPAFAASPAPAPAQNAPVTQAHLDQAAAHPLAIQATVAQELANAEAAKAVKQ